MAVYLILSLAILLYVAYRLYQYFCPPPNLNSNGKYVLISGCDTGFGHALAIELDRQGFNVLAGVYVPNNVSTIQNELSSKATVFQLDITKEKDIEAAYDLIKRKTNTLHGLVNNAGLGVAGYIDWTTLEVMRTTMDVNFFGHVAMTKKFLPLLINKRDSRVVNITSCAGIVATAKMSAYAASKYALEAFSDCLRREMKPWGLRVSIIEPGFMRTPIIEGGRYKSFDDFRTKLTSDAQERWGEEFLKQHYDSQLKNFFIKNAEDPVKVVRALQHAIISTKPQIRYRPGWQASLIIYPLSLLPAWFVDLFLSKTSKPICIPASVNKQQKD